MKVWGSLTDVLESWRARIQRQEGLPGCETKPSRGGGLAEWQLSLKLSVLNPPSTPQLSSNKGKTQIPFLSVGSRRG